MMQIVGVNYFRPSGMAARTGDPMKAASAGATAVSQSAPVAQAAPAPVAQPVVEILHHLKQIQHQLLLRLRQQAAAHRTFLQ
jgi:hypothetical protein